MLGARGSDDGLDEDDLATNGITPSRRSPRTPHRVFDRPRQPHDWRWVVGGTGRLLIIVGLLMFAFVAYQLWGTGIYTGQAQDRLDDQFDQLADAATTTATSTTVPVATTIAAEPSTSTVVSTSAPGPTPSTASPAGSTATTTDANAPTAVAYPFAAPQTGNVLVQLDIPRIKVHYKVVEGVGLDDLAKGPGHFPESVLPGQLGNAAIAGHRTTHGAPFYDVNELAPGDQIILTYPQVGGAAARFVYLVTGTEIVKPTDYAAVVPTVDPAKATLVLTSCHPRTTAAKRIIVHADLDPGSSSELFAPTPHEATVAGSALPGDDDASAATGAPATATSNPVVTATSTIAGGTDPATTTAGAAIPTSSVANPPTATNTSTPATANANTPPASHDAFTGGWFDDNAAWPQVIGWGLALAAIACLGYLLARRSRRIWLGTLVACAPFVLVLYFWFENIDRLLPPGL